MSRTVTARDVIVRAFRLCGIVAQGEDPTAAEIKDGFAILNDMVDGWATQRLTMRAVQRDVFDLVAGQQDYTIGPASATPDWEVAARPTFINGVGLILGGTDPEVETALAPMTDAAYEALAVKGMETSLPTQYHYRATMQSGTFTLWPVPTDATHTVAVYYPAALAQFATLATQYVLAPGYVRALRYCLAVELAPEFGRQIPADVQLIALSAVANIKHLNVPMMDLSLDPALTRNTRGAAYNIWSDQ